VETQQVKLKICGMRDVDNIMKVTSLQPDYMGFIFYAKSPRFVGNDFSLPEEFPSSVKRVGVFVNESNEVIFRKIDALQLDYLQLHGAESVQQCNELKKHNTKVIKVFSVDDQFDFEAVKPYAGVVDFFLFDTKGKYYGGNAQTFNWSILDRYDQQVPFFLSGGLGSDNISGIKALQGMNLHALDVNSGVEISPALKDVNKIKELKDSIHSYNKV
jgi:phosphoribosylanthranilate isomerase